MFLKRSTQCFKCVVLAEMFIETLLNLNLIYPNFANFLLQIFFFDKLKY